MVTRTRLQRAGEATPQETGRMKKMWIEVQLDKRISQKHMANLRKLGNAVKEVGKTSAWVIREGGKALGDTLSMKYYWEAMDSINKPAQPAKLAEGMAFQKTYKEVKVSPELQKRAEKLKKEYVEVGE